MKRPDEKFLRDHIEVLQDLARNNRIEYLGGFAAYGATCFCATLAVISSNWIPGLLLTAVTVFLFKMNDHAHARLLAVLDVINALDNGETE